MCYAYEVWLLSSPGVFIIFEYLLAINNVINETSPRGPPHGVNQMKHSAGAIAVPFLECSGSYAILAKLLLTGNIKHGIPFQTSVCVIRKTGCKS